MGDTSELAAAIAGQFEQSLHGSSSFDAALDALLSATGGRAAGLWRVVSDELEVIGFRASADMPQNVSDAFLAATARVSLGVGNLGIVKAAVERVPAAASVEDAGGEMAGSATWLQRFGARHSLAVPVFCGLRVAGVLAVSGQGDVRPGSPTHAILTGVAGRLGSVFAGE